MNAPPLLLPLALCLGSVLAHAAPNISLEATAGASTFADSRYASRLAYGAEAILGVDEHQHHEISLGLWRTTLDYLDQPKAGVVGGSTTRLTGNCVMPQLGYRYVFDPIWGGWSFHLGGKLGTARTHSNGRYSTMTASGAWTGTGTRWSAEYAFDVGAKYALAQKLSLNVGYRFIGIDKPVDLSLTSSRGGDHASLRLDRLSIGYPYAGFMYTF